jgi:hypothetical protein
MDMIRDRIRPVSWRAGGLLAALAAALLLGACTVSQPPERPVVSSRTFAADRTVVMQKVVGFLERSGLRVLGADRSTGLIRAAERPLEVADWAACPRLTVTDSDGERSRRAEPLRVDLALDVVVERLGGRTVVTVRPAFVQTSRNSFTNLTFENRCGSSGRLERAILAAI